MIEPQHVSLKWVHIPKEHAGIPKFCLPIPLEWVLISKKRAHVPLEHELIP